MLQTKSINANAVAVSWNPTEIFLRPHGKDQFGKEIQLLSIKSDGTLAINKSTADQFGIKIEINDYTSSFKFPKINMVGKELVRYFSLTNPWIDVVIIIERGLKEKTEQAVRKALNEYWDSDDGCYGDFIEMCLNEEGISHQSVYHDANDESEEYEKAWEEYLDSLYQKL